MLFSIKSLTLCTLIFFQAAEAQKPTPLPKKDFPQFGAYFAESGLNWEPYETTTYDGWVLRVFRVYKEIDPSLTPLVIMAGAGNIPDDWGYSWVVDVANNGYDCWLTSWRGLGTS